VTRCPSGMRKPRYRRDGTSPTDSARPPKLSDGAFRCHEDGIQRRATM
jgi:hypothetical protein